MLHTLIRSFISTFHSQLRSLTTSTSPTSLNVHCLNATRSVLRVNGDDCLHFLQGLITNDTRQLMASVLSPKGKLLHDVFLYQEPGLELPSTNRVLMEVDSEGKKDMLDILTRYKLRRQIVIEDVCDTFLVWAKTKSELLTMGVAEREPSSTPSLPTVRSRVSVQGGVTGGWSVDPRLPELGWRGVFKVGDVEVGDPSSSDPQGIAAYRRTRYHHGVAEGMQEMISGNSLPLEFNLDVLNGVSNSLPLEFNLDVLNGISYTKGCYVGQERISFSHFRGIIRRRCIPFRISQPSLLNADLPILIEPGSMVRLLGPSEEQVAGTVLAVEGNVGLALLKLSHVKQVADQHEGRLLVSATDGIMGPDACELQPFRPHWWLPEWGQEETGSAK
ncbi:hypothetical protein CEUSTIGMA_g8363.t1 [Chlamydomonas eustigma]|uniref:CAF17 C-terminal domain-containing protein n=1 Tax=Chlamydomonas eustigma TaxID=1157962 RepID=A0A250XCW1_9CHLO|nr:hypothetical protein CEUSTIGMA_g8363.t1 [Chlamydomonas eustigma]|eukprot:GAX80928.1 hypothetical protein CEUSTIGMA_g8363.t1 [Chlamydomonas eustigma]